MRETRGPSTLVVGVHLAGLTLLWTALAGAVTLLGDFPEPAPVVDAVGRLVPATPYDAWADAVALVGLVVQPTVFLAAALAVRRPSRPGPWLLTATLAAVPPAALLLVTSAWSGSAAGLGRWLLLMAAVAACGCLAGVAARHHLPSVVGAAVLVPSLAVPALRPAHARESVVLGGSRWASSSGEEYLAAAAGGAYLVGVMLLAAGAAALAAAMVREQRRHRPAALP